MISRQLIFIFTLLTTFVSHATSVSIVPIFSTSNWIAGLTIPLRVTGIEVPPSALIAFEVVAGTLKTEDCKLMQDPFISQNFLLKCVLDGTASIRVTLKMASASQPNANPVQLNYGPMTIRKIDGLKLPKPGGGGGGGTDPEVIAGQQLFASNCIGCHTKAAKQGRTASQISAAIASNTGRMGSMSGLTSSQINQISKYLNAP